MAHTSDSFARAGTAAVALASFGAYAWTCAATPYLLDSAELAHGAFGLGVAHPPGEPVALLWGKLFTLLPLGSVALRVGLSQAVAGAAAAALVFRIVLRLVSALDPGRVLGPGTRALLAAGGAFAFAFAPGAVGAASRPEVYALQTALSLGALLLALRAQDERDPRPLLPAAFLIGLGVGNHPLVAGLAGVGAAAVGLRHLRAPGAARLVGLSFAALGAGLAALAYLPARAAALQAAPSADALVWGEAQSARGLAWVLSAETFARKAPVVHRAADPGDLPFVLMDELAIGFALLAPVGLFFLLRRAPGRAPAAIALLACGGSIAAALVAGFDAQNPDIRGYLGPALALLAALGAAAVAAGLLPLAIGALRPVLGGILVVAALGRVPGPGGEAHLRHAAAADWAAGRLLGDLPPRAAFLSAHYETAFLVGYLKEVEGRRPDVAWAHLGFVRGPGYAERVAAAEPALAPALRAHRLGPLGLDEARALDARRPLRLEPDEHVAPALRAALHPAGWLWGLAAGSGVSEELPPWVREEARRDRQVRGFFAFRAYRDAELACEQGLREVAAAHLARLTALLPDDALSRALRDRCGG